MCCAPRRTQCRNEQRLLGPDDRRTAALRNIIGYSFARTAGAVLLAGLALTAPRRHPVLPRRATPRRVHARAVGAHSTQGPELTGTLFTPACAPPCCMNVARRSCLMHGCGGMVDKRGELVARHRDWAERFARWGFVALTLDSFGPRGIRSICELKERPIHPWKERTADAYAALGYLAGRPMSIRTRCSCSAGHTAAPPS